MTVLADIVAGVCKDLERRKSARPLLDVAEAAVARGAGRDFGAALKRDGVAVIAEVKRASPSRGAIRESADPAATARAYADAGADAISVLTEQRRFGGALSHLSAVVEALGPGGPPVLRKDFVLDPYQVYEARTCGADCVLLIVALLEDGTLGQLLELSDRLGMQCLVEVHDEHEACRAVDIGAPIVGINNRNLKTLEVDLATTERVRSCVPPGRVVVSESGIRERADVERLARCGIDAVLVGEALMLAVDLSAKLRELRCGE